MRSRLNLLALTHLLALTTALAAQPLGTDLFSGHINGTIVRTSLGGTVTTLGTSFGYFINGLTMDTDNKTLVALDSLSRANPQKVIRIDTTTGAILGTVFGEPPFSTVQSWIEVDQDGDYLVVDGSSTIGSNLFKVKRDGSGLTTVFSGPTGAYYFSFTEDKSTGDWLIGDFASPRRIIHLDRNAMAVKTLVPLGAPPTGMMQDPQRSEVIISGGATTFLSYHPITNVVKTLVAGAGSANVMTLDRAPDGTGALLYAGMTTGAIHKFARDGTNLGVVANTGAFGVSA